MATVTSIATINRTIDETFGSDTPAPAAGSWRNDLWSNAATWLEWGRRTGKLGIDFPAIAFKFRNMSPTIPPQAKILNAIVRGTSTFNSAAETFFTIVTVNAKDGWWDPEPSSPQQWRSTSDWLKADFDTQVYSTGLLLLADTLVPGITIRWELRSNAAGRYLQLGQGIVITTAANLGFVDMLLSRTAAVPAGNIWCEIYAMNIFTKLPIGGILATSTVRPASAVVIGVPGAVFRFTFPAGQQIPLTANQQIVCVLNGDYPVGIANVRWHWDDRTRYPPAHALLFGTGTSMDDQNYPMRQDFQSIPNAGSDFAAWVTPQMFTGVEYDTPDISGPVKQYLIGGTYAEGDPFCVLLSRSEIFLPPGDASRRWSQFGHATYTPTRLIVQWRKRKRQII
jgi:hypothetical protein